jgi:cysteine desulfurase
MNIVKTLEDIHRPPQRGDKFSRYLMMKQRIYLDYAATTPVDRKVLNAMLPYFHKEYGNPSSLHNFGQKALAAIDGARENVAEFLDCDLGEVIFTGSATEANNLALQGVVRGVRLTGGRFRIHIVTSTMEHDSVLETCRALEKEGVEVTYLPVTREGFVRPEDVKNALKENTVLVSLMYANNEIGTIQPIPEVANIIRDFKNSKFQTLNPKQIHNTTSAIQKRFPLFHTDAVQAANYLDCNVGKLGVDLLTLSGHKMYGPKGIGALYIKKGTPIEPLVYGGGQERGMRSGTENVAAIVGMGEALSQIASLKSHHYDKKIKALRDELVATVLEEVPGAKLNGALDNRLPNNANFLFPAVDAESLIIALDQEGIAVSSGSACSTRAMQPSHVLLALGLSREEARSSIRITLGKSTTEKEIEVFLKSLTTIVKRIRMGKK